MAYSDFEMFKRPDDMTIPDYMVEFHRRYYKFKKHGMELPDQVLAFRLLKSCNMSDIHFQLAMSTTTTTTFEEMKKTLQRMFGDGIVDHDLSGKGASGESVQVKAEPVLEVSRGDYRESRGRYYRSYRPGYRSRRGSCGRPWSSRGGAEGGRNPPGLGGEPTKCFTCGSVDHWARECTKKEEASEDQGDVQLTLLADCVDRREKLMSEALGSIVLDSGCSTTVCGKDWLQAYVDTLSPQDVKLIKEETSETSFKFGDGKHVISKGRMHIPCYIHWV